MKYRLWDTDINRLFGTFDNEDEALALVRTMITSYGPTYADDLALGCERADGSFTLPLTGAELVARTQRVAGKRETVTSRPGQPIKSHFKATSQFALTFTHSAAAGHPPVKAKKDGEQERKTDGHGNEKER